MNLRNNKGFVLEDVSIAIIIILILVPVIMGIVFSINSSKNTEEIKSEALNILTNTMEIAKANNLEELTTTKIIDGISNLYGDKVQSKANPMVIKTNKASYQLEIQVVDYADDTVNHPEATANVVKTVKAIIEFRVSGKNQKMDLSTVVQ